MNRTPANFTEACKRAGGRRAYNRRRRLERARRISEIFRLLDQRNYSGRELAARLGVHEATISRDLQFIRTVKRDWERSIVGGLGFKMYAHNFRWIQDARGWETSFELSDGVRIH